MKESDVNIAFGTLALTFACLVLLPLPQHIRIKNTGTILMAGWGFVGLLTQGINAFIFHNSTNANEATLRWCDFSAAIGYAYPFGYAAGSLALLRRLETIASTRQVAQSTKEKRVTLLIDLGVGLGGPLVLILLHFCVQGHRLDVVGDYGCVSPLYLSVPTLFIFCIWQVAINATCLVYAMLVIRWFFLRRRQFAAILHSSGSGMSQRRYLRLMALASTEILLTFPLSLYIFISNASQQLEPWVSWSSVHYGFGNVNSYMIQEVDSSFSVPMQFGRWMGVIAVFIFLCFFAPTAESLRDYSTLFSKIFKRSQRTKESELHCDSQQTVPISNDTIQTVQKSSSGYFNDDRKSEAGDMLKGEWIERHELQLHNSTPFQVDDDVENYGSRIHVQVERVVA